MQAIPAIGCDETELRYPVIPMAFPQSVLDTSVCHELK